MYQEHPIFIAPEDPDVKIWRYMSLSKLISMISSESLFFTRADRFEDKYEGSYSHANIELRSQVYPKGTEQMRTELSEFSKNMLRYTVINCWHINENESAAMWKLYSSDDEGVAIQSTYNRLITSFDDNPDDIIYVGKVNYIDYNTKWLPEGNTFYPFVHKRKSFEHERELRAVIQKLPTSNKGIDFTKEIFNFGKNVNIYLDTLIENIYVAPTSKSWFYKVVKDTIDNFRIDKQVLVSDLSKDPVF